MPETFYPNGDAPAVAWLETICGVIRSADSQKSTAIRQRNDAIRAASADGTTQAELARITGLSRAQVQRICDYSKDGEKR